VQAGLAAAAGAVPLAIALLLAFDVASGRYARRFGPPRQLGWGVSSHDHPIGAAEFVARHGLEGPLFNNIAAGSYLIGRFGERLPVFVDGRLLDPAHFRLYRELLGSPPAFERYAEAHGLRLVVLALQPHAPVGLFRHLYAAPHWQLVYFDGEGAVFVHRAVPRAATLPALRLEAALAPVPAAGAGAVPWRWRVCDPGEAAVRGSMLLGLGFPQAARADLTQALLRCTERWDVGLELSSALIAVGRSREALPLVERALRHDPAHAGAWVNLGLCYAAAGDSAQARRAWQRARSLEPSDPRAAALLGDSPVPAGAP
jgi:tetratricopeptide (TPR) repeat protein